MGVELEELEGAKCKHEGGGEERGRDGGACLRFNGTDSK